MCVCLTDSEAIYQGLGFLCLTLRNSSAAHTWAYISLPLKNAIYNNKSLDVGVLVVCLTAVAVVRGHPTGVSVDFIDGSTDNEKAGQRRDSQQGVGE